MTGNPTMGSLTTGSLMPDTYWQVARGGPNAGDAKTEDFEEEWEAMARYEILVAALHNRHDSAPGDCKRWEHYSQRMSNHWNARSVVDGHEENVWFWKMQR